MKKLFFAVLVILSFRCLSQQFKPLQAEGTIPKEFVTKSSEKYLKEKQNLQKSEEKKTQKSKKRF